MKRTTLIFLVAAALAALVVAGCGGGGDQATAASSQPSTDTINVTDNGDLGKILTDSQGRTIYMFAKDTGSMSTCSGGCAAEWPPVTTSGKPTAGNGLTASMVGTTTRSDGTKQVTYNGHPLYGFSGDQAAGDTNGQNLSAYGAKWYALSSAGNRVTASGSGSGGGYSY